MNELDKNSITGTVFYIQRFSLHDGPGIRTTMFMKGCPLSCKWCSNPESINPKPQLMYYESQCTGCLSCVQVCPVKAISVVEGKPKIDRKVCTECFDCVKACSYSAMQISGKEYTVDEAMKEILKDKPFYGNSGGGVTISGGEPLQQWKFVHEVFKRCKAEGIHTTLDTTGNAPAEVIDAMLEVVDLWMYDVKHLDTERHFAMTGVNNQVILNNLKKVAANAKVWIRVPLIPDFNDSEEYANRLGKFVSELKPDKLSLLPYHKLAEQKYRRLDVPYPMDGVEQSSDEHVQKLKSIIENYGIMVKVGV